MANSQKEIFVSKASGEKELFSDLKLSRSLEKAKAPAVVINKILEQIKSEMKDGMKTSDIYRYAFSLLRKQNRTIASRYALKRAIMELGPSGYPFEKLVGELLKTKRFIVKVGETVQGACVSHEIDVVAKKDDRHIMVECKFHNQPGTKSDVKVALYVQARFEDVQKAWQQNSVHGDKFHEVWLVTNTKLTSDAIRYAECVGMKAIGWNYPAEESLEIRIDRSGLHPITCLTTLSGFQKQQLIEKGIVLCQELLNKSVLRSLGLQEAKISAVVSETEQLCKKK